MMVFMTILEWLFLVIEKILASRRSCPKESIKNRQFDNKEKRSAPLVANRSISTSPTEERDELIERGEIVQNMDKMLICSGMWMK